MVENKEPFKVVFDNIIINTMNNFLEDTRLWKATERDDKHLKETPLKVLIAEKFGDQALTADEKTKDIALDVDVPALIARIEQHLNIEFVSGMKEFAVLGSQSFFTKSIAKRAPKVKHMSFVDLSKGKSCSKATLTTS
jgi:phage terminase small subunit